MEKARKVAAQSVKQHAAPGFHNGDFADVAAKHIGDGSVSLIFTDPPYDRESLPLYSRLAAVADRVLADGGSLVTYLGHRNLTEVKDELETGLRFFWPCAVFHTGRKSLMREYGVSVRWKPLLWFVKGNFRRDRESIIPDAILSEREKETHPWQQSVIDASHFIERLTTPGELVFDPFAGGGTTAVAATQLGREFITCDIDPVALKAAGERWEASR